MLEEMGKKARAAAYTLARTTTDKKNQTLLALAEILEKQSDSILAANAADVQNAKASGLSESLVDRLTLNPKRLSAIASDLRAVVALPDPIGERFDETNLPSGLHLWKQRVPLGVLGVIYEARPNVTIDIAGLAIKTGNAAILRGGKETIRSNTALVAAVQRALVQSGLPVDGIQFLDNPDRALVLELLKMDEAIDLIIPRGGEGLHRMCRENSRIPVVTGGIGICHLFVDETADLEKSLPVIHNAKTQRPSVCNALDTVLAHRAIAERALPAIVKHLAPAGVTFRAEPRAFAILQKAGAMEGVSPSGPQDFDTEWMSLVLGLKVVDSLDEAIEHIDSHSLHHSDGILTANRANAERFMAEVDSAAVYVNASTRFTDGGQFGLGAEVAISTVRVHARGPMGLRELTTYKWVGEGDYLPRA